MKADIVIQLVSDTQVSLQLKVLHARDGQMLLFDAVS